MASFLGLPNEVILKIILCFDVQVVDEVQSLLSMRLTCRRLSNLTIAHLQLLKHGLKFRLCSSIKETKERIGSFLESSSSQFKECFTTMTLDSSLLHPVGEWEALGATKEASIRDSLRRAQVGIHCVEFLLAAAPFIHAIGPQVKCVEILSPPIGTVMQSETGDRIFRTASQFLFYASARGLLPNLTIIRALSEHCYVLAYIHECVYDVEMEARMDFLSEKYFERRVDDNAANHENVKQPAHTTSDVYLQELLDAASDGRIALFVWSKNEISAFEVPNYFKIQVPGPCVYRLDVNQPDHTWRDWFRETQKTNPCLSKVEEFYTCNNGLSCWPWGDTGNEGFLALECVANAMPKLSKFTFSTDRRYTTDKSSAFCLPRTRPAVDPDPDRGFLQISKLRKLSATLTSLELIDCKIGSIPRENPRRIEAPEPLIYQILDSLLPALPLIQNMKVEGLIYHKKYLHLNVQGPQRPWNTRFEIVPDGTLATGFRRPMVTPFIEDLNALFRLCDDLIRRRTDMGLPPQDSWLEFIVKYKREIGRLMTIDEIATTF